MRTLFTNASIVAPDQIRLGNLLVEDGKILDTAASISAAHDQAVDCQGLHLLPGVVDDQVHFREPGLTHKEDLETASRACAAGGVTSFLEMPNTVPPAITVEGVRQKQRIASAKSLVNYGFYIGATPDNIQDLIEAGSERTIPGIKIFIGSSTGSLLVDEQDALERIFAETKLSLTAHCEDESTVRANAAAIGATRDVADHSRIRDHAAARIATARAIDLATRHSHHFHVLHVSTAEEVPLIAAAKKHVTAEVCLHHLLFSTDDYARLGTRVQMNPSVKTPADNDALWRALQEGTISVIATDHAPHTLAEKAQEYPASPSGLPAVENSLALMLNQVHAGRCTLNQVVHWMCAEPARIWQMDGKGRLQEGYDADLVLVDLDEVRTVHDAEQHTKSKWSPWDGERLTGWPQSTYVGGDRVWSRSEGFSSTLPPGRRLTFRDQTS